LISLLFFHACKDIVWNHAKNLRQSGKNSLKTELDHIARWFDRDFHASMRNICFSNLWPRTHLDNLSHLIKLIRPWKQGLTRMHLN
jgi:hypothetical protein